MRGRTRIALLLAPTLLLPSSAAAAITLATYPVRPALRVDARGNAEVSWTAGGVRRFVLVPPTGRVYPGRRLAAPDVSRGTSAVAIPFRRVLRRTPDGRYWSLQTWRIRPGGPVELRFSRWRGQPPMVTAAATPRFDGELIAGRATFAGRAVPLYSPTPEGKRIRSYAYVDRALASRWERIGAAATRVDGSFRLFVAAAKLGRSYRVALPGPNIGATLAPDAVSPAVPSARR